MIDSIEMNPRNTLIKLYKSLPAIDVMSALEPAIETTSSRENTRLKGAGIIRKAHTGSYSPKSLFVSFVSERWEKRGAHQRSVGEPWAVKAKSSVHGPRPACMSPGWMARLMWGCSEGDTQTGFTRTECSAMASARGAEATSQVPPFATVRLFKHPRGASSGPSHLPRSCLLGFPPSHCLCYGSAVVLSSPATFNAPFLV